MTSLSLVEADTSSGWVAPAFFELRQLVGDRVLLVVQLRAFRFQAREVRLDPGVFSSFSRVAIDLLGRFGQGRSC